MEGKTMIRFGTIGSNWIVDLFIEIGKKHHLFTVTACYSRTKDKGEAFAKKHDIAHVFTDLEEMAKSSELDAVYIASPNILHCEQSMVFLKNNVAVLCEKPMATNALEARRVVDYAKNNKVLFMHAMRNLCEPRFKEVRELLPQLGEIRLVNASRCQYSSRYDDYKNGIIQNAFNPTFGNGSLMDIGVYLIVPMVATWGQPRGIKATAVMLENHIDGAGCILADYGDKQVNLMFSKISPSHFATEIQGENGSLYWTKEDNKKLYLALRNQPIKEIMIEQESDDMVYEIREFVSLWERGETASELSRSEDAVIALEVMDEYRKQVGLKF
jgi:predicted dehydrogenase